MNKNAKVMVRVEYERGGIRRVWYGEMEKTKIENFNGGEENFICMENEGNIKWLEKDSLVSIETLEIKTVVLVKPRITDFNRDHSHKNVGVCF